MKSMITLLIISVTFISILVFSGCEKQSPVSSITPTEQEVQNTTKDNGLQILAIGDQGNSFNKVTTSAKWISAFWGGLVKLDHYGDNNLRIFTRLYIWPQTMNESAEISLTIDDQQFAGNVDVVFEPHGITFSQPALLNIYAYGLDLSGVDPNSLNIYYDNPDTGQWELMQRDGFYVFPSLGTIYVINAKIPHFSRYAIGAE